VSRRPPVAVVPAQAGTHLAASCRSTVDPGLRRDDVCKGDRWSRLLLAVLIAAALAACAKRSEPLPPKDQVNTYPRAYPNE